MLGVFPVGDSHCRGRRGEVPRGDGEGLDAWSLCEPRKTRKTRKTRNEIAVCDVLKGDVGRAGRELFSDHG